MRRGVDLAAGAAGGDQRHRATLRDQAIIAALVRTWSVASMT
jgi:hypothetical protein